MRQSGILLHSLVVARWPASPVQLDAPRPVAAIVGLLDQQYYVRQPILKTE